MMRGRTLLIFLGQRSKVKDTIWIYGNILVHTIETEPSCIFVTPERHVDHGERMNLLIFEFEDGGHNGQIWQ